MTKAEIAEEVDACALSIVEHLLTVGVRFHCPPEDVPDKIASLIAATVPTLLIPAKTEA